MVNLMTNRQIAQLRDGVFAVGGVVGLYVRKRYGKLRFLMRWCSKGVRRDCYLPRNLTLLEARKMAVQYRLKIDSGIDPRIEKKEREVQSLTKVQVLDKQIECLKKSFRSVAMEWLEYQREIGVWRNNENGEHSAYLRLRKHAFPRLEKKAIHEITVQDISELLTPIWDRKASGDKLYYLLRRIFAYAIVQGYYREENPVDKSGVLGVLLQPLTIQRTDGENRAALPYEQIPEFIVSLIANRSAGALAVAFSVLTATRFKAVRLAEWSEFNLNNPIPAWEIPIEHDKNKGKGLRTILLSPQAIHILEMMRETRQHERIIFPSLRGTSLSDSAPSRMIHYMNEQRVLKGLSPWTDPNMQDDKGAPMTITQHGTARSSFRTYFSSEANRKKFDQEAVELCLLHKVKPLNGAYDRSLLVKARYEIMLEWGRYCFSLYTKNTI